MGGGDLAGGVADAHEQHHQGHPPVRQGGEGQRGAQGDDPAGAADDAPHKEEQGKDQIGGDGQPGEGLGQLFQHAGVGEELLEDQHQKGVAQQFQLKGGAHHGHQLLGAEPVDDSHCHNGDQHRGDHLEPQCQDEHQDEQQGPEMLEQVQRVQTAVLAGGRARVLGQAAQVGEIAQQGQHHHGYHHPHHKGGQRHPGQGGHEQHPRIGGQGALRDVPHPAGDKRLLPGGQVSLCGVLHNVAAEDHGRGGGQKPDEQRRHPGVHPAVVEQSVQVLLGQLDLLAGLQHPLQIGDEVEGEQHRQGVPVGEHPQKEPRPVGRVDPIEGGGGQNPPGDGQPQGPPDRQQQDDHQKDHRQLQQLQFRHAFPPFPPRLAGLWCGGGRPRTSLSYRKIPF